MFIPNVNVSQPLAYPNAYISSDEPPKRSLTKTALCGIAIAGIGYFGLVMLVLSLFTTQYSPLSQYASDYGVGAYGPEMNSGFFLAGAGFISLALVVLTSGSGSRTKTGGALLALDGLALMMAGSYQADIEGAVATFHGQVHNFAGVMFFLTSPVAMLLVSSRFGRRRFATTFFAMIGAVVFVTLNGVLGLDATGLAERLVLLVLFPSLVFASTSLLNEP